MILTVLHGFTDKSPIPDVIRGVRLRCGSRGSPAVFDFDQVVDVKAEIQGYVNADEPGGQPLRDPDALLLSVVNADTVFKNYSHFSFLVTGNVSNDIDEQRKKIEKLGFKLSFSGFPGERITVKTKSNLELRFNPDELYRSENVKLMLARGSFWTHTGATLEGTSGGAIYLERGAKKPLLQGITVLGLSGTSGINSTRLYEPNDSLPVNANAFVPLYQIQELIQQKNRSLWEMIRMYEAMPDVPASPSSPSETAPSSSAGSGTADSARTFRPTQPDTYPPRRTNF